MDRDYSDSAFNQVNARDPRQFGSIQGAAATLGVAGQMSAKRVRRLDAIHAAADTAARMAEQLDLILARFTGNGQSSSDCESPPIGVSYTSAIDRLQDNLNRISLAIEQIEEFA